jgi:PLP dependent protein
MPGIDENLNAVRQRLDAAGRKHGRDPAEILLVAVSKTCPATSVQAAYEAGQRDFGENYVQEGVEKVQALATLPGIVWHFIGPLQSNKTRPVAEHFDWVHSIDRLKIAQRLAEQRPSNAAPLNVCLQVNVSGEESKSGVAPEEVLVLAQAVAQLPRLSLRGLMCIPEPSEDEAVLASRFGMLVRLRAQLHEAGLMIDTLSMGMSADMEAAIAAGATMIRLGTAIFGSRPAKPAQ